MYTYLLALKECILKIKLLKVEMLHQRGWIIKFITDKPPCKNESLVGIPIYNLGAQELMQHTGEK